MVHIQTILAATHSDQIMQKPIPRTYSGYSRNVTALLGQLIRLARKERKLSAQEVADRAGISRGLLQRIETGHPGCGVGMVFEVATIVGVKLFGTETRPSLFDTGEPELIDYLKRTRDKLVLLSEPQTSGVNDDF